MDKEDTTLIKYGLITVGAIILLPKLGGAIQEAGAGIGGGIADIGGGLGFGVRRAGIGIGEGAGGVFEGLGRGIGAGVGGFYAQAGVGLGDAFRELGGGLGEGIFNFRRGLGWTESGERWDEDTVIITPPPTTPPMTPPMTPPPLTPPLTPPRAPPQETEWTPRDEKIHRLDVATTPIRTMFPITGGITQILHPAIVDVSQRVGETVEWKRDRAKEIWDWVF